MPGLPDVEVFRRELEARALGHRVLSLQAPGPRVLQRLSPQTLGRRLHGRRLERTRRHGKFLFVGLDRGPWLVLHFGMTGHLDYAPGAGALPSHTAVVLHLDRDLHLAYVAPRRLGRIGLTPAPQCLISERRLGPDALALDKAGFRALARHRRGAVKCWLMNQRVMAGIGNVYADEILFQARIRPATSLRRLDAAALDRVYRCLRRVLAAAIRAGVDPRRMPRGFLVPRREDEGPCPVCGGRLARGRLCGRTTLYCPQCQGAG